jgi:hypothetical protein
VPNIIHANFKNYLRAYKLSFGQHTFNMGTNGHASLPDPTIDLHWDDFQGPIHSFFDENAKSFPERVCVIGKLASNCYLTFTIAKALNRNCLREFSSERIHIQTNLRS